MTQPDEPKLSRREREVLDILFRRGRATASQVREDMSRAPGYSAVRATLRVLEEKGHVLHEQDGPRYVYRPSASREKASRSALRRLVGTFFDGSVERAVAALLDGSAAELDETDFDRLEELVARAREEGK